MAVVLVGSCPGGQLSVHPQHMAVNITLGHRNVDVERRFD